MTYGEGFLFIFLAMGMTTYDLRLLSIFLFVFCYVDIIWVELPFLSIALAGNIWKKEFYFSTEPFQNYFVPG